MKNITLIIALLFIISCSAILFPFSHHSSSNTIPLIHNSKQYCYATIISEHLAITTYHCTLNKITIAQIIKINKMDDLALLRLNKAQDHWATLRLSPAQKGESVSIAGRSTIINNPTAWIKSIGDIESGELLSAKVTISTVDSLPTGFSGSPLYDNEGQVLGIFIGENLETGCGHYAPVEAIIHLMESP